jgi:hypothetical protein
MKPIRYAYMIRVPSSILVCIPDFIDW